MITHTEIRAYEFPLSTLYLIFSILERD